MPNNIINHLQSMPSLEWLQKQIVDHYSSPLRRAQLYFVNLEDLYNTYPWEIVENYPYQKILNTKLISANQDILKIVKHDLKLLVNNDCKYGIVSQISFIPLLPSVLSQYVNSNDALIRDLQVGANDLSNIYNLDQSLKLQQFILKSLNKINKNIDLNEDFQNICEDFQNNSNPHILRQLQTITQLMPKRTPKNAYLANTNYFHEVGFYSIRDFAKDYIPENNHYFKYIYNPKIVQTGQLKQVLDDYLHTHTLRDPLNLDSYDLIQIKQFTKPLLFETGNFTKTFNNYSEIEMPQIPVIKGDQLLILRFHDSKVLGQVNEYYYVYNSTSKNYYLFYTRSTDALEVLRNKQ